MIMTQVASEKEWRKSLGISDVDISAFGDEKVNDVVVSRTRRKHERSPLFRSLTCVDVCTLLHEFKDPVFVSIHAGRHQRCGAVGVRFVRACEILDGTKGHSSHEGRAQKTS